MSLCEDPEPTEDKRFEAASILASALPYIQRHAKGVMVIKMGGNAMGDAQAMADFARDITLLKQVGVQPVVVHGGGPQIGRMMERLSLKPAFIDGLRVTDAPTVEVVEMVLAGSINKAIVSAINAQGGRAVGLSGKDGGLITARKLRRVKRDPDSNIERELDMGFVGEPARVDPEVLEIFIHSNFIPVIAPVGADESGQSYNINGDTAAGAIAGALKAARLMLLTDVPGIKGADGAVIAEMRADEVRRLIEEGVIHSGMIPKAQTALDALEGGVEAVAILDGRAPHAALLELFTEYGAGTLLRS